MSIGITNLLRISFVVTLLILDQALSESWSYVHQAPLPQTEKGCSTLCLHDSKCVKWTLFGSKAAGVCLLESVKMQRLRHVNSDIFQTPEVFRSYQAASEARIDFTTVSFQRLIGDPMPLDGSSIILSPQHFVEGCEYTIATWAWIWRTGSKDEREQSAVFSTRASHPYPPNSGEHLFPGILFNIPGDNVETFFFAATKDARDGSYVGSWSSSEVIYNRWVHLTLVVRMDRIDCYVDGRLTAASSHNRPIHREAPPDCPYWSGRYNVYAPEDETVANNTILQIGGVKEGKIMQGMLQDFIIFQNLALEGTEVAELIRLRPPTEIPMFENLLDHYKIARPEKVCLPDWQNNYYLQHSWGLCPDIVCGSICLADNFPGVKKASLHEYSQSAPDINSSKEKETLSNKKGNKGSVDDPSAVKGKPTKLTSKAQRKFKKRKQYEDTLFDVLTDEEIDSEYDKLYMGFSGIDLDSRTDEEIVDDFEEKLFKNLENLATAKMNSGSKAKLTSKAETIDIRNVDPRYNILTEEEIDDAYGELYEDFYNIDEYDSRTDEEILSDLEDKLIVKLDALLESKKDIPVLSNNNPKDRIASVESNLFGFVQEGVSFESLDQTDANKNPRSSMTSNEDRSLEDLYEAYDEIMQDLADDTRPEEEVLADVYKKLNGILREDEPTSASDSVNGTTSNSPFPHRRFKYRSKPPTQLPKIKETSTTLSFKVDWRNITGYMSSFAQNLTQIFGSMVGSQKEDFKLPNLQEVPKLLKGTVIGKVHELYDGAILLLSGRHDQSDQYMRLSTEEWGLSARESAQSALMLSLWLADDIRTASDEDISWNSRYSSLLAQPIHLALGQLMMSSIVTNLTPHGEISVKHEDINFFRKNLTEALGGKPIQYYFEQCRIIENVDFDVFVMTFMHIYRAGKCSSIAKLNDICEQLESRRLFSVDIKELEELFKSKAITLDDINVVLNSNEQILIRKEYLNRGFYRNVRIDGVFELLQNAIQKPLSSDTSAMLVTSLYFPVVQYIVSHWGMVETGVRMPEDIRLNDIGLGNLNTQIGEDGDIHIQEEAAAADGNPEAMVWLGRRYFWGYGGVAPNMNIARHWYDRAAEQNHAEALYNVGVFNAHGIGGYTRNETEAIKYFKRAALRDDPFPMAMEALGNYFKAPGPEHDLHAARQLFERAADMGSAEGHFALSIMMKHGEGGPPNIPLAVLHLAQACSLGNIRAINYLAHALWDPESWLAVYAREREYVLRSGRREVIIESSLRWTYNSSAPIQIFLPNFVVTLPCPLGVSQETALILFRHLSTFGTRVNDISEAALDAYIRGESWEALDYFDEAAVMNPELGMPSAVHNTIFLLSKLMKEECQPKKKKVDKVIGINLFDRSISLIAGNFSVGVYGKYDEENVNCTIHFSRMLSRRLSQLADAGDPHAYRSLAELYARGKPPFRKNITRAAYFYSIAAALADVESYVALGWLFASGAPGELQRNTTIAKKLFATAKDIEGALYEAILEETMSGKEDSWEDLTIPSTGGLAPQLAESLLYLQASWEAFETSLIDNSEMKRWIQDLKCLLLIDQGVSCVVTDGSWLETSVFWTSFNIFLAVTLLRILVFLKNY